MSFKGVRGIFLIGILLAGAFAFAGEKPRETRESQSLAQVEKVIEKAIHKYSFKDRKNTPKFVAEIQEEVMRVFGATLKDDLRNIYRDLPPSLTYKEAKELSEAEIKKFKDGIFEFVVNNYSGDLQDWVNGSESFNEETLTHLMDWQRRMNVSLFKLLLIPYKTSSEVHGQRVAKWRDEIIGSGFKVFTGILLAKYAEAVGFADIYPDGMTYAMLSTIVAGFIVSLRAAHFSIATGPFNPALEFEAFRDLFGKDMKGFYYGKGAKMELSMGHLGYRLFESYEEAIARALILHQLVPCNAALISGE